MPHVNTGNTKRNNPTIPIPSGGPKDTKPSEKDNVVDADFEDVKEDKEKSA